MRKKYREKAKSSKRWRKQEMMIEYLQQKLNFKTYTNEVWQQKEDKYVFKHFLGLGSNFQLFRTFSRAIKCLEKIQ